MTEDQKALLDMFNTQVEHFDWHLRYGYYDLRARLSDQELYQVLDIIDPPTNPQGTTNG